ncbi:NAD(P)/FAD-dependent oxidoreductase [Pseudomonas xantholysinigenes]|uniref:FAD-binding oxidoreductase n=1 Tax=Pseudomonas xantholysinigenes TaxID=2745490 RepID=A0A9E6PZN7_9PSED|nr:FAD-binding oxidoreductase [Pseudomonas xantholysinigenes]QXI40306.1 FAD-binding oxidoreductase [Pseudomonas xantholysinigenes]
MHDNNNEPRSFWQHDYGTYLANSRLAEDLKVDLAVIGGGFTGLNTAWQFKRDNPGARVLVLEAALIGFGASGRNAGFSTKLFGLEPELVVLRWGKQRMIEAHRYLERAVAYTREVIEAHAIDSDYRHAGLVRVSYSPRQLARLGKNLELYESLGLAGDMRWQSAAQLRERHDSPRLLGGIHESETGYLDPCKQVRGLKGLAASVGVRIHEATPVLDIDRSGASIVLRTPNARVNADKLVIATNAYARQLPGTRTLQQRQFPLWTYQVITEPLGEALWRSIGWDGREAFGDNRQMLHYFRPTVDGRIVMGGGDVLAYTASAMAEQPSPASWAHCEAHLKWIYPQLRDVRIAYRWGGPVSVNADMVPEISFIDDERMIYAGGCFGHGVALSHLNGRTIADLLQGRQSELSDFWIVNRKAIAMPGTTLSCWAGRTARQALKAWDWWEERGLKA